MAEPNPDVAPGTQRQMEIYKWGLAGKTPGQPVSVEDLGRKAKSELKPEAYDYLAGGAGSEDTMRANREAFRRWRIVPRFLRDVSRRDLGVDVLGQRLPAPLMLAPIGVQSIFHKQAELAVARAARAFGVPFILSSVSSTPLEEVAAEMGDVPRWFQLYWPKSDALAASFLQRAERAGYGAVVVTLDTYLLSWRERDIQNAYLPFVHGEGLANYFSDPVFREAIGGDPRKHPVRALEYFGEVFSDPSRTWDDLARLRQSTRLPILLKGILHPDDARRALDHGVGGRHRLEPRRPPGSTGPSRRSTPCRAWWTRSVTGRPSCSTAASGGVRTSSRPSRWCARACCWAGPIASASPSTASKACATCWRTWWPTST